MENQTESGCALESTGKAVPLLVFKAPSPGIIISGNGAPRIYTKNLNVIPSGTLVTRLAGGVTEPGTSKFSSKSLIPWCLEHGRICSLRIMYNLYNEFSPDVY